MDCFVMDKLVRVGGVLDGKRMKLDVWEMERSWKSSVRKIVAARMVQLERRWGKERGLYR